MSDQIESDSCEVTEEKAISEQLGKAILSGLFIIIVMAIVSPLIYGKSGDTYGFFRTIFETSGPAFIKGVIAMVLLFIFEYGLKGCWIRKIYDAAYGSVILVSVLLYCVLR